MLLQYLRQNVNKQERRPPIKNPNVLRVKFNLRKMYYKNQFVMVLSYSAVFRLTSIPLLMWNDGEMPF